MINRKNAGKKILLIFLILLFLTIIGKIGQYFFLKSPLKQTTSTAQKPPWEVIDVLQLPEWKTNTDSASNIKFQNGMLTLDNTFGRVKDGYYSYNNRAYTFPVSEKLEVALQFFKRIGNEAGVRFATKLPQDENDRWSSIRAVDIVLLGKENNLYIKFYDTEKNISEIFLIGEMPNDGKITIKIIENKISVFDSQSALLDRISLTEKPFNGKIAFGVTAGPKSIIEISQFLVNLSPKL